MILRVRLAPPATPDAEPQLVATITSTTDLVAGDETRTVAASVDEIVAIVERWVEEFVRGASS